MTRKPNFGTLRKSKAEIAIALSSMLGFYDSMKFLEKKLAANDKKHKQTVKTAKQRTLESYDDFTEFLTGGLD
jgi:hypothetical protein